MTDVTVDVNLEGRLSATADQLVRNARAISDVQAGVYHRQEVERLRDFISNHREMLPPIIHDEVLIPEDYLGEITLPSTRSNRPPIQNHLINITPLGYSSREQLLADLEELQEYRRCLS